MSSSCLVLSEPLILTGSSWAVLLSGRSRAVALGRSSALTVSMTASSWKLQRATHADVRSGSADSADVRNVREDHRVCRPRRPNQEDWLDELPAVVLQPKV